ncbi:arsenical pump-driving ATPase [Salimicrobium flavidum]|uniref:Arsenite efflux ATP-binding protein ArsA n=1 Tax=Salimicrobium flavidum TaxID=570947 RepID=A0A1N7IRN0_9BACI|nr:arsenical pump-driving ATPase [Salimicrobium flavidum]SIS39742.1 arsenite efflux ATP-binding protein ArsA [Salimicrobium flavidum]
MFQPFDPSVSRTPFLFYTGKGGVGKTTTATATAIHLADEGKEVLLVSTDPASNLQDVLQQELSSRPRSVETVPHLYACNIDPEQAAMEYKEKVLGPYRSTFPESVVSQMEEQLSGACTVEIAAFDEFTAILSDPEIYEQYDHVVFDTAPTGHTLRLLQLPTAWSGFLEESTHGASCLGPLSGLSEKKEKYEKALTLLADGTFTTLFLVARADRFSLEEAGRSSEELKHIGMKNQQLIINGVFGQFIAEDATSRAIYERQQQALQSLPDPLKQMPVYQLPYVAYALTSITEFRYLMKHYTFSSNKDIPVIRSEETNEDIEAVIDGVRSNGTKVLMTMGKGGVGKTTVASMIAMGLAGKGEKVHVTTTDPAGHLLGMFEDGDLPETLSVDAIDPKEEVELYKEEILQKNAPHLDADGLAYLKEDLESPCTEEIALFQAFASKVDHASEEITIIDTAPTGHTLLLLDASEGYHKEVDRSSGEVPESVKRLMPRLRNPQETEILIVTLPEATPVLEAERLQEDLRRASMEPSWWIVNQSLSETGTKDPLLQKRAEAEYRWIDEVARHQAAQMAVIPWMKEEQLHKRKGETTQ